MTPDEARKLLGGWSAGILTGAEKQALLEAALEDQALFDAMMEDDALRELLEDGGARAELRQVLEARPRWYAWLLRPWPIAAAGGVAVVVLTVGFVMQHREAAVPAQPRDNVMLSRPYQESAPVPKPPVARAAKPKVVPAPQPVEREVVAAAPPPIEAKAEKAEALRSAAPAGGPAMRMSLRKDDADGPVQHKELWQSDGRVVVTVQTRKSGFIRVFRKQGDAAPERVGDAVAVTAGQSYTLPAQAPVGVLLVRFYEQAGDDAPWVFEVPVPLTPAP